MTQSVLVLFGWDFVPPRSSVWTSFCPCLSLSVHLSASLHQSVPVLSWTAENKASLMHLAALCSPVSSDDHQLQLIKRKHSLFSAERVVPYSSVSPHFIISLSYLKHWKKIKNQVRTSCPYFVLIFLFFFPLLPFLTSFSVSSRKRPSVTVV